jgi:NDP-sugar pyrophosphorylase family protein
VRTEYGVLHLDDQAGSMFRLSGFEEKPEIPYVVSMGVYVLEPGVLDYIEPGERLDLPDLVLRLLADRQPVGSYLYDGYWLDIGRHEDYEQALLEFEQLRPMFLPEREPQAGTVQ